MVLAVALCVTACEPAPVYSEQKPKRLEIWYYWDSQSVQRSFRQMIQEFNDGHPDIEVVSKYIPDEDFKKQLALAIADDTMPALAVIDSADVFYFDSLEPLADLSELIDEEEYMDIALASCRKEDGTLIGLPLGLNCLAFFYNENLLERAGVAPPENLEEFQEAAEALTSRGVYGCAFPSIESEESVFCFLPVLWGMGGSLDDIDSEESRRAFDFLRQLSLNGAMSPNSIHMTLYDITRQFARGELAMMFNVSVMKYTIQQENPQLRMGVAPIPTGDSKVSVVGGEVLSLMDTEDAPEAMEFVKFMAEPERIRDYLDDFGYFSPREDLFEWQREHDSYCQQFQGILETARTRDFKKEWPLISTEVSRVLSMVLLHEDQEDTLEKLAQRLSQIQGGEP